MEIFNAVNTDQGQAVKGKQVIDEKEFIDFYHGLLEREEIGTLFAAYASTYAGILMTDKELKKFLEVEQRMANLTMVQVREIMREYEPSDSPNKRSKKYLMSREGFSRFILFSDTMDIIDHQKMETVYQVKRGLNL